MIDHITGGMFRQLIGVWDNVAAALPKLHASAQMRPALINDAIRQTEASATSASFEILPVVFKVPELIRRASGELFVVVRGRIAFGREEFKSSGALVTTAFSTEVGYFARRSGGLWHVFGAHYDFAAKEVAHPAFHAQIKSFADFADPVRTQYNVNAAVVDEVKYVLETVRLPTAQMDVFSVFLQICADHLMHAGSGPEERAAFDALVDQGSFCTGAAWQVERLMSAAARSCYRSRHWYPTSS